MNPYRPSVEAVAAAGAAAGQEARLTRLYRLLRAGGEDLFLTALAEELRLGALDLDQARRFDMGEGPETLATQAARMGFERALFALLEAGASPNARAGDSSPLLLAAQLGHRAAVKLLLARGADPEGDPSNSFTPLTAAAWRGSAECCHLLLEAGADPRRPGLRGAQASSAARALGSSSALQGALAIESWIESRDLARDLGAGIAQPKPAKPKGL